MLTLTADCTPDCDTLSVSMIKSPAFLMVDVSTTVACSDSPQTWQVPVDIDKSAPVGPQVFQVIGTGNNGSTCTTLVTVNVDPIQVTNITATPSSIAATTAWPGMPVGLNTSTIQVVWDPQGCEGTLKIVEVEPIQGYTPPGDGTLTRNSPTEWMYTAFDEPPNELCPKLVKVWVAAMQGDTELHRVSILVRNVHNYWTQSATRNFLNDYNFITWKYAAVHATTSPKPSVVWAVFLQEKTRNASGKALKYGVKMMAR